MTPDTTATVRICGDSIKSSGGRIAFGSSRSVYIAESKQPDSRNTNPYSTLQLGGWGGITYNCRGKIVYSYDPSIVYADNTISPLTFNVPVKTSQVLTTSDANQKTNIEPLTDKGNLLTDITPVSYRLKSDAGTEEWMPSRTSMQRCRNSSR